MPSGGSAIDKREENVTPIHKFMSKIDFHSYLIFMLNLM